MARADGAKQGASSTVSVSSASSTTLVNVRPTRHRVTFINRDASNFVWIDISGGTAGTSHAKLTAGQSITFGVQGKITALADTASVSVGVFEEYD